MGHLSLYISKQDEPVFERLRRILKRKRKSLSAFLAEAAEKYVGDPDEAGPTTYGMTREGRDFIRGESYRSW